MNHQIQMAKIVSIAKLAGKAILNIYHDAEFSQVVDFKSDNSPLTLADRAAHDVIVDQLDKTYPDIPIISEEGAEIPYEKR
ncbi:MAG: 3'(2'),5'-bisphosphate nucleotidase CysQ, partial [Bacteroidetes bacterium]